MAAAKKTGGFTDAERAAMKQRAAELREESRPATGGAKRAREAKACEEAIAALEGTDKAVAALLDAVVAAEAPHLDPKTWYGFPSYARDGNVVVFYQPASKFDTRSGTVGFTHDAHLDAGPMWATSFAVVEVNSDVEARLRTLVARAAG
jgi:uncharacterized protein YdhG (YjbR/CyaY superfamily)